ncbi:DUF5685 family protein [[Clostridium] polysaccharolyticum]|uniref:Uncharacterized protein n=1 Tax=[Clostridium] polysaccharolyticum TaxID=29364 RepID=A0A1I0CXG1_9FIRM|nr:DUF5685 family protein [[Clostridium] polysaccharolyticum]SET24532.1 hypothetical protein SAMN04487772_1127 [[Clostridium] polysaccharolyticum]
MFGYVTIDKLELKVKDYYKYRAYYCGLCKTLKERHGRFGQMTLTYDMTFLILVLTSLYEKEPESAKQRCLAHPASKHWMLWNQFSEYAADLNIALAFHNFADDWADEKKISGYAGAVYLKKSYKKIADKYPRQCQKIEEGLKKLGECEQRNEENLDIVSDCFGEIMGELFVYQEDEWQDNLRQLGYYLGKFIYLLDAYDDLPEDIKKGNYNPFKAMAGQPEYHEICEEILEMLMAECAREYEKLPLLENADILHNILYTGVWVKYKTKKLGEEKNNDSRSI